MQHGGIDMPNILQMFYRVKSVSVSILKNENYAMETDQTLGILRGI